LGLDHGARALWFVAAERAEIRPASVPSRQANDLRLRGLVSGISRGTESLVFRGEVPESERERMRCPFQEGEFPFPVKYGYSMVALVEEGPPDLAGARIFCMHPHQTRFALPAAAAIVIPTEIPTERAVLAAQMETALNATWDAAPRIGDRIAVIGAGVIGCLAGYLFASIPGTSVTLIDRDEGRQVIAGSLGLRFATVSSELVGDCDLVLHASGNPEGLDLALSLAGFEADVLELSWYGRSKVTVSLGGPFHSQRLSLRSSQVGAVAPARRARWDSRRRLALALALCRDPRLDILVKDETSFEETPAALPKLLGQPGALFHLIRYD
jgi:hypothetical protein